jgi:hypothetical protein
LQLEKQLRRNLKTKSITSITSHKLLGRKNFSIEEFYRRILQQENNEQYECRVKYATEENAKVSNKNK